VYVIKKNSTTGIWNETAKLTASDATISDHFGDSISIDSNTIAVGAPSNNEKPGSVCIFEKNNTTGVWTETAKLTASDATNSDHFGHSLSLNGDIIVIGAPGSDGISPDSGGIYIFQRDNTTGVWTETAKLHAPDGTSNDLFGYSISVDDDILVASAPADNSDSGSAYIFERNTTNVWTCTAKLTSSDLSIWNYLGYSVSTDNGMVVVGAPLANGNEIGAGSIYLFKKATLEVNAHGPYNGIVGQPITFSGSATGGVLPYTYHWDFGDGNTANQQNPQHAYSQPETYIVTLTVTDADTTIATDETTAEIFIIEPIGIHAEVTIAQQTITEKHTKHKEETISPKQTIQKPPITTTKTETTTTQKQDTTHTLPTTTTKKQTQPNQTVQQSKQDETTIKRQEK